MWTWQFKAYQNLMASNCKLEVDSSDKPVLEKVYKGKIRSLLDLITSKPNIMLSVCLCTRFQSVPKESQLKATKRTFKLIARTNNLGLWYLRGGGLELIGYFDANYAGNKVNIKCKTSSCHFLIIYCVIALQKAKSNGLIHFWGWIYCHWSMLCLNIMYQLITQRPWIGLQDDSYQVWQSKCYQNH